MAVIEKRHLSYAIRLGDGMEIVTSDEIMAERIAALVDVETRLNEWKQKWESTEHLRREGLAREAKAGVAFDKLKAYAASLKEALDSAVDEIQHRVNSADGLPDPHLVEQLAEWRKLLRV